MTAPRQQRAPVGLGKRGLRLWGDLQGDGRLDGKRRILAEEACRIADRLESLDGILRGKRGALARIKAPMGWPDTDHTIELIVDQVLIEARQQANALRQILATIATLEPKSEDGGDDGLEGLGDLSSAVRDP